MKRSRNSSKSSESVGAGNKDEPPKKLKKRVKSVTQSPASQNVSEVQQPAVLPTPAVKHSPRPNSASKLGSLPMYGEDLPDEGYASVPKLAEKVCGNLRVIMEKVKELKAKGGSRVSCYI